MNTTTADVDRIAQELANELRPLLKSTAQVNTVCDEVVKPMIRLTLAQVNAPLVEAINRAIALLDQCKDISARKMLNAALTGTGEKK